MEGFREVCTTSSNDNFLLVQSYSVTIRKNPKKKKDFTEEEFLHKKINNKGVYVYYGVTEDIPEDACSLRQLWKFDSIKLK